MLTERPLATPIAKFMSTPLVTLPATATAAEALQLLAERRIRQLAVVDGNAVLGLVVRARSLRAATGFDAAGQRLAALARATGGRCNGPRPTFAR